MAELRRKAQEHSAALLQSLHAAAAAGLAFPGLHLPPLSFHHSSLSNAHHQHHHAAAAAAAAAGVRMKNEAQDMTASTMNGLVANMMPQLMDHQTSSTSPPSNHNSTTTPPSTYQQQLQHQQQQLQSSQQQMHSVSQLSPPTTPTQMSSNSSSKETPLNCTNGAIITKTEGI